MPSHKVGDTKTLANGAVGVWKKNEHGKLVFRIQSGASASYMASLRATKVAKRAAPLSQTAAQARFDRYYGVGQFARGRGRGHMKGKTRRGRRSASTYDKNTPAPIIMTGAYHPRSHDYRGVDLGSRPRKKASVKQAAALRRGRAALRNRRAAANPIGLAAMDGFNLQQDQKDQKDQQGGQQEGGFWW